MITDMTISFKTQKAAKEFCAALNEALDVEAAKPLEADKATLAVEWRAELDPTELLDALTTARDEMEWEFDE